MVLKYVVSPSAFTEDFIIRIWEATNDTPGGEIYSQTLVAPHAAPVVITVNGLDKVVHIVRMYGVTSATLLHEANVEPITDTLTVFAPLRFKIGDGGPNTPVAGSTSYQNDVLRGLTADQYTVFRNNYGMLQPTIHYDLTDIPNGIFNLIQPDDQWFENEEVTIQPLPANVSEVVNDSVVAKLFGQTPASDDVFIDINANTNYSPLHLRKYLRLNGTAQYTFNVAPPIGYGFTFGKFGSTGGVSRINFTNAPLLWINGTTKAFLDMVDGEQGQFFFDGTNWNCAYLTQAVSADAGGGGGVSAGTILGIGTTVIGDVPSGDPSYEVIHNLNISGEYHVWLSIQSNSESVFTRNNKIGSTWWHHEGVGMKPNRFKFSLQEITGEVQDLSVNWLIVKA